jgi:hypothetical protein
MHNEGSGKALVQCVAWEKNSGTDAQAAAAALIIHA